MMKSYQQIGKQFNCSINNQLTYLFLISSELIDFSESIWIKNIFFYVFQNTVFEKKIRGCNYAIVSSITRKILVNWNLGTNIHPKFVTLRSSFKDF